MCINFFLKNILDLFFFTNHKSYDYDNLITYQETCTKRFKMESVSNIFSWFAMGPPARTEAPSCPRGTTPPWVRFERVKHAPHLSPSPYDAKDTIQIWIAMLALESNPSSPRTTTRFPILSQQF